MPRPRTENREPSRIDYGSWFLRRRVTPSVPCERFLNPALQSAVGAQFGGLRDSREVWRPRLAPSATARAVLSHARRPAVQLGVVYHILRRSWLVVVSITQAQLCRVAFASDHSSHPGSIGCMRGRLMLFYVEEMKEYDQLLLTPAVNHLLTDISFLYQCHHME